MDKKKKTGFEAFISSLFTLSMTDLSDSTHTQKKSVCVVCVEN